MAATLLSGQADDAAGDDFGFAALAGDLASATAEVGDDGRVVFTVRYHDGTFDPNATVPTILIDADDDPLTGSRGLDTGNNDEAIFGPEVALSPAPFDSPTSGVVTYLRRDQPPSRALLFTDLATALSDGWRIEISLQRIDDDGLFTFAVTSQQAFDENRSSPINDYLPDIGVAKPQTSAGLVASVLPTSRSIQVPSTATVFATIINTGRVAATECGPSLPEGIDADFSFQTTDPATNLVVGTPDTAVDLAPGASQTFLLGVTPRSVLAATDVAIDFSCGNVPAARTASGINTLLLSADDDPVADIVALALTVSADGVLRLDEPGQYGFFAIASVNVGVGDELTLTADTGAVAQPVDFLLCQTDPVTSVCINPSVPGPDSVTVVIGAAETPTFAIFARAASLIGLDPSTRRVYARFFDTGGSVRGSTSVALTAVGPPERQLDFNEVIADTVFDADGFGTGFTTRLLGTGGGLAANDANLVLDTNAAELRLLSTAADLNGQANVPIAEFPGIGLAELGFTGSEDFEVRATFASVGVAEFVDQAGVFVGVDSASALRGGFIVFDAAAGPERFSVHTSGGLDGNLQQAAGAPDGDSEMVLQRIAGIYSLTIDGTDVPVAAPAFLDGATDLTVGVFASNAGNVVPKLVRVSRFVARVF